MADNQREMVLMKMYILVNKDLNMSVGKTAGQVGHAICDFMYSNDSSNVYDWHHNYDQTKIILGVKNLS